MSTHERYRSIVSTVGGGTAYFSTGIPISGSGSMHNSESHECWDWVRSKSESQKQFPLEIKSYVERGGRLNKDGSQGNHSIFSNFVPAVYQWGNFPHHTVLLGNPSDTQVATEAAARTNPSRPYVDVPVFIFEMADFLQLIRDQGRSLIKRAGKANVAYQFGIFPIIDDFVKLLQFAQALRRRMEEIKRLNSDNGLRKTTRHGTYSAFGVYAKTLQSQGVFRSGNFFANTRMEVKAHCRWKVDSTFGRLSAMDVEWLVKRSLHGLQFDAATVWESLPWTWMIDYFSTVGSYLRASRNIIPCHLDSVTVMRHTKTIYEFGGLKEQDFEFSRSSVTLETKSRKIVVVAPEAHVPFLTANQLGILLSLSVIRDRSLR